MKTRTPLWLIDLDNTLYDASWRVMGEINRRLPPEQRYAAVMKLDTDKLYSVVQPR